MIKLERGQISMEGSLGDLMVEAARIVDTIAKSVVKNANQEDVDYDFVISTILMHVVQVAKINTENNVWGYEEEMKFLQEARDLRNKHKGVDDFIDYDSGSAVSYPETDPDHKKKDPINLEIDETRKNTSSITGGASLDGFVLDTRLSDDDILDIKDIKNIRSGKKKGM